MGGIRCPGCDYELDECSCFDEDPAPKFETTFCSQCGGEFGPGEHGYSHCSDHKGEKLRRLRDLGKEGPGMSFDDVNKAVAIARGGMGPDEMCVEYFERIAELKDALRACLKAFEAGKDVPGAVVPREKFLDELRALVR